MVPPPPSSGGGWQGQSLINGWERGRGERKKNTGLRREGLCVLTRKNTGLQIPAGRVAAPPLSLLLRVKRMESSGRRIKRVTNGQGEQVTVLHVGGFRWPGGGRGVRSACAAGELCVYLCCSKPSVLEGHREWSFPTWSHGRHGGCDVQGPWRVPQHPQVILAIFRETLFQKNSF